MRNRTLAWVMRSSLLGIVCLATLALLCAQTARAASDDYLSPDDIYVVEEGDTLLGIAFTYGVDVDDLILANNLGNPHHLRIGQRLVLPLIRSAAAAPTTRGNLRPPMGWPASGPISSYFGERGRLWHQGWHPGLDIAASWGAPVRAALGGWVIESESGYNWGYGSYIKIDHGDGLHTLYAHLSRRFVGEGEYVSRGELIGLVGATGFAIGPHLHFEVRVWGEPQNPLRYLP